MADALGALDRILDEIDAIEDLLVELKPRLAAVYVLLDQSMFEALPPLCPKCGSVLVIRAQYRNAQNRFLGCTAWPRCKGSMRLDAWRVAAEAALRARSSNEPTPA